MKGDRPTIQQLELILELNNKIVALLPQGDPMRDMYEKMISRLTDRIQTYDKFYVNPYTQTASQPKMNSDTSLELGGYVAAEEDNLQ